MARWVGNKNLEVMLRSLPDEGHAGWSRRLGRTLAPAQPLPPSPATRAATFAEAAR